MLLTLAVAGAGCASRREESSKPVDAQPATPPVADPAPQTPSAATPSEAANATAPLSCTLQSPAKAVAGKPVSVSFELTNVTNQTLYVLTWNTPLEGRLLNDTFEVTRDGVELPYLGPMVKRAPPTADSYVAIAPKASVTKEVEISNAYGVTTPGAYGIEFRGSLMDVTADKARAPPPDGNYQGVVVKCPLVETLVSK